MTLVLTVFALLCVTTVSLQAQNANAKSAMTWTEPFDEMVWNVCTQEYMHLTGTWHYTMREWNDANGCVHFTFHQNFQHGKAVGESGAEYVAQSIMNATDLELKVCDENDCWRQETFTQQIRIIGKGKTPDRRVTITERATFNLCNPPTYDISFQFEKARVSCTAD